MTIERPTWGDGSGRSSGVAVTDDGAVEQAPLPARTDKREPRVPIVRPDWSQSDNSPAAITDAPSDLSHQPDKTLPRGDDGKFITAEMAQLRETWEREGGYEHNLARARETANAILSRVSDPEDFAAHFDTLPQPIQSKIIDVLRLSPTRRTTANDMLLLIEDSLTPQELATARTWVKQLLPEHHAAIIRGLGGGR